MNKSSQADSSARRGGLIDRGLDLLGQGFGVFDRSLHLVGCNAAFRDLRGYRADECRPGAALSDLLLINARRGDYGPGDPAELVAERMTAIGTFEPRRLERRLHDGRHLAISYQPIANDGLVVSFLDVTEIRRAEQALKRSEERYALVAEAAEEGIYEWLIQDDETYISPRLQRFFKFTGAVGPKDLDWETHIHPEDLEHYRTTLRAHLEGHEQRWSCEYRFQDQGGDYVWVLDHGTTTRDEDGTPRRMVAAIRDISELKAREAEVAEKTAILEATLENMDQGISMVNSDLEVIAFNHRFLDLLEFPPDQFKTGFHMSQAFRYNAERGEYGPGDVEEQIRQRIDLARRFEPHEFERTRPDGTVIEIRGNPLPNSAGFVTTYSDITKRKKAEEGLRVAKEQAERALAELTQVQDSLIQAEKLASLGQMTAGIAHEIKNPLNFVNNFAELSAELLGELKETLNDSQTQFPAEAREGLADVMSALEINLGKIAEHGNRADRIVKSMLEHARHGPSAFEVCDLNVLIEDAVNLAYHAARAENSAFKAKLKTDLDGDVGQVRLNKQDFSRAILNLLNNALHAVGARARAADEGYEPTITVTSRSHGETVEVAVRDNGTGIPEAVKETIFEPFFTTKPAGEGTGLGLSLTYEIVTQGHGGTMSVTSEEGRYSEFTLRLSRERPQG